MRDFGKWRDPAYEPELTVLMIDPHDLDRVRGELTGITAASITQGYYSDTKVSGALTTVDDNYIANSWLRFQVEGVDVGTFGVSGMRIKQAGEKEYELQSVMWMLSEDIAYYLFTIGKKAYLKDVISKICTQAGKQVTFSKGYINKRYASSKVYEQTDSLLSILNDICDSGGDQLGVDGHGRLTVAKYITPAKRSVSWDLDPDDPRGIVLDPGYEDTDQTGAASNRTVVIADAQEGKKRICEYVDPDKSNPVSFSKKGWRKTTVHTVSELSPWTAARARALAKQYLADDSSRGITRDVTCMYFPGEAGEIVTWGGGRTHYLIQTKEDDYVAWTSKLTLKEL